MKTIRQVQVYSMISNIVALTFIISGCSGLLHAFFNCSNYTFHENSTKGRSWETSRLLCQNSFEGDLVSIEEEEERNFVINIIINLTATEYFIGLKKDNGKWKWLSNQTTVNSSPGQSPWAPGQPSGKSGSNRKDNCATIYGKYRSYLGRFDDLSCSLLKKSSGHICERAVSCSKHEGGSRTTQETQKATSVVRSTTRSAWKSEPATPHHKKAEERSYLIAIVVSVLAAFVILGTCVALLLFLGDRPRIKGLKLKIQRYQRQSNSIQLEGRDGMSPTEQEMDDCKSLPTVKRQDACVTIEEGDVESFLSTQELSTKRPKEAFIKERSSTDSYSAPLYISSTTRPSKVVVKKDPREQHHVYVHIHSKQDKTDFHLDHVMQDLGEWPSQVTVDEENGTPSVGLEKEFTKDEDVTVKQNSLGQDQCNDCVYAVVDKTMKNQQPAKEPVPYQELVYVDLSHSPKKIENGRIHQENTASIYAGIDHIKSSATSDSTSQQENEAETD